MSWRSPNVSAVAVNEPASNVVPLSSRLSDAGATSRVMSPVQGPRRSSRTPIWSAGPTPGLRAIGTTTESLTSAVLKRAPRLARRETWATAGRADGPTAIASTNRPAVRPSGRATVIPHTEPSQNRRNHQQQPVHADDQRPRGEILRIRQPQAEDRRERAGAPGDECEPLLVRREQISDHGRHHEEAEHHQHS